MPQYRLDIFNRSGAIRAVARLEFESDEQAIRAVEKQSQGHQMELWCGSRLVKRFPARELPAQPSDPA